VCIVESNSLLCADLSDPDSADWLVRKIVAESSEVRPRAPAKPKELVPPRGPLEAEVVGQQLLGEFPGKVDVDVFEAPSNVPNPLASLDNPVAHFVQPARQLLLKAQPDRQPSPAYPEQQQLLQGSLSAPPTFPGPGSRTSAAPDAQQPLGPVEPSLAGPVEPDDSPPPSSPVVGNGFCAHPY